MVREEVHAVGAGPDESSIAVDRIAHRARVRCGRVRDRRVVGSERPALRVVRRLVESDRVGLPREEPTADRVRRRTTVARLDHERGEQVLAVRVRDGRSDERPGRVVQPHRRPGDHRFTRILDAVAVQVDPDAVPDLHRSLVAHHLEIGESVALVEARVLPPGQTAARGQQRDATDPRPVAGGVARRVAGSTPEPVGAVPEADDRLLVDGRHVPARDPDARVARHRGGGPVRRLWVVLPVRKVRVVVVVELLATRDVREVAARDARSGARPVRLERERAAGVADPEDVADGEGVRQGPVREGRLRERGTGLVGLRVRGEVGLRLVSEPVAEVQDEVTVVGDLDVGQHRLRVRGLHQGR
jgi:hypothetical protein